MKDVMRQPAKVFTDLLVWEKAHNFVISVYRMSKDFPKTEIYGLTSQIRRAAVSIPANIAEGFGRNSVKEKIRYLEISKGSLEECRYYLILSKDIGYCDSSSMMLQLEEVGKLLNSSLKNLEQRLTNS
jgi:four helix bundle protein